MTKLRHLVFGLCALALPGVNVRAGTSPDFTKMGVVDSIPIPDGPWDYASIDARRRKLYVGRGDGVFELDLASGKINPRLVGGEDVHGVIPVGGGRALSADGGTNSATLFDATTGAVVTRIPTGRKPDSIAFDPVSGLALVMDGDDGDATLVDPRTGMSPGRIAIGGSLKSAVADGRGRVFVNIEDRGEIAMVDTSSRKVVARYQLPGCKEPSGIAVDPERNLLLTVCGNQKALALNAGSGAVLVTFNIGRFPDAIIYDRARRLFFIPCGGDGIIDVIAEEAGGAPKLVASIPTAIGARTGALDPRTGRLYLPTADYRSAAAGQRPTKVPGTYRVLVVGMKP